MRTLAVAMWFRRLILPICLVIWAFAASSVWQAARPASILGVPPEQATSNLESLDVTLSLVDTPTLGKPAPIVLVEFADFECSFCARFADSVLPLIRREYVQTGTVQYAFVSFPLPMHKNAPLAARAAECARQVGRFWEMHDLMFRHQNQLQSEHIRGYAEKAEINDDENYRQCVAATTGDVSPNRAAAQRLGIRSTPSFVVAIRADANNAKVMRGIRGAHPYEVFKVAIDEVVDRLK